MTVFMHHGHAVLHRVHALLHGGLTLGGGLGGGCLVVCRLHFLHLLGHGFVLHRRGRFACLSWSGRRLLRVMFIGGRDHEWAAHEQGGEN
ncbi:hypothetical protein D3C85_1651640 [compost metagenome]